MTNPNPNDPGHYPTKTDTVVDAGWFGTTALGVTDRADGPLTIDTAFNDILAWDVLEDTAVNGSTFDTVPELKLIRRDDNDTVIGWGHQSYRPITNAEMRDILATGLADTPHEVAAIGSLRGGARVFVAVKLHDAGDINIDGDTVKPYMLFHNTFDGSSTFKVVNLGFRPSCTNALSMALAGGLGVTKVRHTVNAGDKFPEIRMAIRRFTAMRDAFQTEMEHLIRTEVTSAQAARVIEQLAPTPKEDADVSAAARTRAERRRDELTVCYHDDPRVGFTGTAWGLLQAYSTWSQNDSGFRATRNGPANRDERKIERAVDGGKAERRAMQAINKVLTPA